MAENNGGEGGQNNDNLDIGLNIDFGNQNLFEMHHKALKEGAGAGAGAGGGEGGGQAGGEGGQGNAGAGAGGGQAAAAAGGEGGEKEVVLDTTDVLKMAADAMKNKTNGGDGGAGNGGTNAGSTAAAATAGAGDGNKGTAGEGAAATDKVVIPEYFKALYEHLTTNLGYSPLTNADEFDGSPEKFQEWMETERKSQAEEMADQLIEDAFINNPANKDVAQDLFKFLQKGGKVADFVETRKYDAITAEYISTGATDDEKADRAKTVMSNYYLTIGWDQEAIDKNIKSLETSGQLVAIAETTLPQFIKLNEQRKAIAEQNAATQTQRTQGEIKEYNTKLLDIIDKSEELGTFQFKSAKEKQAVKEFLFVPSIAIQGGGKTTPYLAALDLARKNPAFTLYQALTFMNNGVDLSKLTAKIANNTKQDIKTKLESVLAGNKIDQAAAASSASGNNDNNRTKAASFLDFDNLQTVVR